MPITLVDWVDGEVITKDKLNQMKNEAASVVNTNEFQVVQRAPTPFAGEDTDLVNRKFYFDNMTGGGGGGASLPPGGASGAALVKQSSGSGDVAWRVLSAGDVGAATIGQLNNGLAGKSDTNHTHPDATTSVSGFMSDGDKLKLDGSSSFAVGGALIQRDGDGRARVYGPPLDNEDIANKAYVDSLGGGGGLREIDLSSMTGGVTVDLANKKYSVAFGTLTGNTTLSFLNIPASGAVIVNMVVTQDNPGGRTLTFPLGTTVVNAADGTIDGTANSRTSLVFTTMDGGTHWDVGISDARPSQLEGLKFSPPGDGTYLVVCDIKATYDVPNVLKVGTGTLAWSRSTNGGGTYSAISSITTFNIGDVLKLEVTSSSGPLAVTLPRYQ